MAITLVILIAYAIGATPFGFVAGKLKGVDIRQHGSGNIGATNAFRVLGKPIGITVFFFDFLKGFVPVWIAKYFVANGTQIAGETLPEWAPIAVALATILGHNFTFWLGFKGGKGIATSGGALLGLMWPAVLIGLVIWAALFFSTRYVALASLGAAASIPITVGLMEGLSKPIFWFAMAIAILAFIRHRANIRRLLTGTELRFERKNKTGQESDD